MVRTHGKSEDSPQLPPQQARDVVESGHGGGDSAEMSGADDLQRRAAADVWGAGIAQRQAVTAPGGLTVELFGRDEAMHRAAIEYWSRDERGRYLVPVASIAERLGVSSTTSLGRHLRTHARACDPDRACPSCGKTTLLDSRNEAAWRARVPVHACAACQAQQPGRAQSAERTEIARWCLELAQRHPEPLEAARIAIRDLVLGYGLLAVLRAHRGVGEVIRVADFLTYTKGEAALYGTAELDARLLIELVQHGYLAVDPSTPKHAFEWDETGSITNWRPLLAHYAVTWTRETIADTADTLAGHLTTGLHYEQIADAWHRIIGADAAGHVGALMQFRYGCPAASAAKDEELLTAVFDHRPPYDPGQFAALAWSAAQYGFGAAYRLFAVRDREGAGSGAAAAMARWLAEPKGYPQESYKRQPLLHPWSLTARLFLAAVLPVDPANWQHSRARPPDIDPDALCWCELETGPNGILAHWPGPYLAAHNPSLPGIRRVYLAAAHREAGALSGEDAAWLIELAGHDVDAKDDLTRAWLGVMASRALIHARTLLDRDLITPESWCTVHYETTELLGHLARYDFAAAEQVHERTRVSVWSPASDQQRRAASIWLREHFQGCVDVVDVSTLASEWPVIENPEPEYKPLHHSAKPTREFGPAHWTALEQAEPTVQENADSTGLGGTGAVSCG